MKVLITTIILSIFFFCLPVCKAQVNIAGPQNVLVVYKSNDNNSQTIANYYKDKRDIPDDNMLPLDIPTIDIINDHTIHLIDNGEVIVDGNGNCDEDRNSIYNQTMIYIKTHITQPIEDYLNTTIIDGIPLAQSIRYIVMCKGIPIKATTYVVDFSHSSVPQRRGVSVDALVSIINQSDQSFSITNSSFIISSGGSSTYNNPYYHIEDNDGAEYNFNYRFITKTYSNLSGFELNYLVSRLDGYDYNDVIAMIDRGADPDMAGESIYVLDGDLTSYTGNDVSACRFDVHNTKLKLDNLGFMNDENESDVVIYSTTGNCMGYESSGSHSDATLFADYCVDVLNFNYSNGAIFNTYESYNGYAFDLANLGDNETDFGKRAGAPHYQGLIADFIHAGGTGGESHVYEPWTYSVSRGQYTFPAYAMGYSLVEAIYMGIPYLAFRNLVVGDPLTTIAWGKQTTTKNISMSGTNLVTGVITISSGDILTLNGTIRLRHQGFINSASNGTPGLILDGTVILDSDSWDRGLLLADNHNHPQLLWTVNPSMSPIDYYKIFRKIDNGPFVQVDSVTGNIWTDYLLDFVNVEGRYNLHVYYYVKSYNSISFSVASNTVDAIVEKSIGKVKPDNNLNQLSYNLKQNYPNPFNPVTTINYQIPQTGFVTLKIYDILGKEVATLVNEQKNQGKYSVNFDASQLNSGVYIYQLRVNDYVSSKKMVLLK